MKTINWWDDMSNQRQGILPVTSEMLSPVEKERLAIEKRTKKFYHDIGEAGESNHGFSPIRTHDAREQHLADDKKSWDVGYGHKLTPEEERTGVVHGVSLRNDAGEDTPATQANINMFLRKDMEGHLAGVKPTWDAHLKTKGRSWSEIDTPYRLALTSLAYNVGVGGAKKFKQVLLEAADGNVKEFAKQMRRLDNKKNTAGMDNRVLKELYYSGLIKNRSEVAKELPLSDANQAGVPK